MRLSPVRGALLSVPIAALALLASGCNGVSDGGNEAADAGAAAVPVRLLTVTPASPTGERVAAGTVRLRRETPLAFVEAGRVLRMAVREGDRVRAGQLLAALDPVALDAAVAAAEAEQARAAAELSRQQTLKQQGWVAQARVDAAAAAARAADAELAARRFSRRFSEIRAPSDGIILQRRAEPGQTVSAGEPIYLLGEAASGHVLRAGLGAADIAGLSSGDIADIRFRDGAAPDMRGTVIEIAGRADPRTATFQVEFSLPDTGALRSGMIAEARWRAGTPGAGLMIPASALFAARADEGFVWLVDPASNRVRSQRLVLGPITDAGVTIRSGLSPGDRIVASGVDRLIEGEQVAADPGR